MKVCYFGVYNNLDDRNITIKEGLKKNKIKIIECNVPYSIKSPVIKNKLQFIRYKLYITKTKIHYYALILKMYIKNGKNCDCIIIGFPNEYDTLLAKTLTLFSKKKIVCDFFNPNYYTAVTDRKAIKKKSFTGLKLWLLDKTSSIFADYLLADTEQHKNLISKIYNINPKKFIVTPITIDANQIRTKPQKKHSNFIVFSRPTFSPNLTGTEYIIQAMKLLEKENIHLYLAGDSIKKGDLQKIYGGDPKNITLCGWLTRREIYEHVQASDICMTGHFGSSPKAECVVSFKTVEAIALKKPIIINKGETNQQIFSDKHNCIMVKKENPKAIANAILLLKNDIALRNKIGTNGYKTYKEKFQPEIIVKELIKKIS